MSVIVVAGGVIALSLFSGTSRAIVLSPFQTLLAFFESKSLTEVALFSASGPFSPMWSLGGALFATGCLVRIGKGFLPKPKPAPGAAVGAPVPKIWKASEKPVLPLLALCQILVIVSGIYCHRISAKVMVDAPEFDAYKTVLADNQQYTNIHKGLAAVGAVIGFYMGLASD